MARSSWQVQETLSRKREWLGRFVPGYLQVAGSGMNRAMSVGLGKRADRWISETTSQSGGQSGRLYPAGSRVSVIKRKDESLQLDEMDRRYLNCINEKKIPVFPMLFFRTRNGSPHT
jgi:hypothetical protein